MNLAHLTYFKTLAETKTYRDTAYECSISQSTLSNAINGLEKELGTSLFVRNKGLAELTETGQIFYNYVDTSLRFLNNGIDIVKERSGKHIREITIGTILSAQSRDWSELIYDYRKQLHGDVQINVVQSTTPEILKDIKAGKIDVAFCGSLGPDSELMQYPRWSQSVVLVVNKDHPFAKRDHISLSELVNHYLISYTLDGPIGPPLTALIKGRNLTVDCLYSDEITLASIVASNPDIMAIACKSWLLSSYGDHIKLVRIEEADDDFRQIFFSYLANSEKPRIVEEFIKLVTQTNALPYHSQKSDKETRLESFKNPLN